MALTFHIIKNEANLPYDLLLLADPDLHKVKTYCESEVVVLAKLENTIVGVYVLEISKHQTRAEILNIAVATTHQNQGIGKLLLKNAIQQAKKHRKQILEIATGNSSIGQLALYQKVGFEMMEIIQDYFLNNYDEPIFENGIQCKHQVRLVMILF